MALNKTPPPKPSIGASSSALAINSAAAGSSTSPYLPATAGEVTNAETLGVVIQKLTSVIISATKEGKTVTSLNRRLIVAAAEEIRLASLIFSSICASPSVTETPTSSALEEVKKEITAFVREEMASIKQLVAGLPAASRSYAQAAATTAGQPAGRVPPYRPTASTAPPVTKPALIISSKKECTSSADTLSAWKKSVSFRDTNFAPANVQFVSNNKLRVEFDRDDQLETTLKKIGDSNPNISAEISKKLKPMIIIKGISTEITPESLKDIINHQNDIIKNTTTENPNDFTFKFLRPNRNPKLYNAVFMCAPPLWRTIMEVGKLNVDHQRVHVDDFCPLLQCYKCLGFGHTKKFCKLEETHCSHCSGTHEFKVCPVQKDQTKTVCHNCKSNAKNNGNNEKINHSATSEQCPRRHAMIDKTRARIDYGS